MNILSKLKLYFHYRKVNMRKPSQAFDYPLTDGDKYSIVITVCLVLIALTLFFKSEIDNAFNESEKRAYDAKRAMHEAYKSLHEREKVLVTFLNGDYVRIDNRLVRVKMCDASGDCYERP